MRDCVQLKAIIHEEKSKKEGEKKMMYKGRKGITLIALVVTIVVLLILAGVTLTVLLGENGMMKTAQKSKEVTRAGIVQDQSDIWKASKITYKYDKSITEEQIANNFEKLLDDMVSQKVLTEAEKEEIKTTGKVTIADKIITFVEEENGGGSKEPEQMEPTPLYAKTYGEINVSTTTIFSSFDYIAEGYGDLIEDYCYETNELNYKENDENPPAWIWVSNGGVGHIRWGNNIIIYDKIAPLSTAYWFYQTKNIEGLENLVTNNVTNMEMMFAHSEMENIEISHFDTSNVTNMRCMFSRRGNSLQDSTEDDILKNINLKNFDTKKVTNMERNVWRT